MNAAAPRLDAFAVAAPGLDPWVARELRDLGIDAREAEGGAEFSGTMADVQRANLWSRLASRVVVRIATFRVRALGELARRAGTLPWEEWVSPGTTVRIRTTARKSRLYHTGAIAQRVAEGLGRRVPVVVTRASPDEEGDAEPAGHEGLLVVRVAHDECTISLDSSGALLHRRGYRQAVAKAPLRETLAAAMLAAGEWRPADGLTDPLCGAGTIAIEAALRSRNIAPGLRRAFAFEGWPGHDRAGWDALRDEAAAASRQAAGPIHASDRDAGAVAAARANAQRAGVDGDIAFVQSPLSAAPLGPSSGWIVTNPPYGVRIGEADRLRDLYAALGRVVRDGGRPLVMLSAVPALERQLGLSLQTVLATRNGGLAVRVRRAWPRGEGS